MYYFAGLKSTAMDMEPTLGVSSNEQFSSSSFQLVYTGSALENGAMNAPDFARAIVALQRIAEEINLRVNGSNFVVNVGILRVEPGSLISTLIVGVRKTGNRIVEIGASTPAIAANNITAILTASITLLGVIGLLNTSPKTEEKGDVVNIYNNNVNITVSKEQYDLANNSLVNSEAAKIVMPLINEGVDGVYFRGPTRDLIADEFAYNKRIRKSDLASFPTVSEKENIETDEKAQAVKGYRAFAIEQATEAKQSQPKRDDIYSKGIYKILSIPIADLNSPWQLKGAKKISVTITDQKFLQQIRDRTLTLGENDAIEIELVQRFSSARGRYEAIQVFRHLPGGIETLASK